MVFKLYLYNKDDNRILIETHEKESFANLSAMNWDMLKKGNHHVIKKADGIDKILKL